jgi:putative transcriptional regulator
MAKKQRKPTGPKIEPPDRPFGARMIAGLTELVEALERGEPLEKRFTVRTVQRLPRPGSYDAKRVRATRQSLGMSQSVFAQLMAVSVNLVQAWERGDRIPAPIACRLLDEVARNRSHWVRRAVGVKKAG